MFGSILLESRGWIPNRPSTWGFLLWYFPSIYLHRSVSLMLEQWYVFHGHGSIPTSTNRRMGRWTIQQRPVRPWMGCSPGVPGYWHSHIRVITVMCLMLLLHIKHQGKWDFSLQGWHVIYQTWLLTFSSSIRFVDLHASYESTCVLILHRILRHVYIYK